MKILVLNCGSSSLKFRLIETSPMQIEANEDVLLARGLIERIGSEESLLSCARGEKDLTCTRKSIPGHRAAIEAAFDFLLESRVIQSTNQIEGVGHRIVHGGERFRQSALIDDEVEQAVSDCIELAPLHNPHNLKGYQASRELLPGVPQVAVFDTAFHMSLPRKAFLYGLPFDNYTRDRLRRYGFHGTSHRFVSYRFAQIMRAAPRDMRLITCHLGNGCSLCAVERGFSVDTSMGFTPLEGLIMGTRCGDVDPGAVLYLSNREPAGSVELEEIFNHRSGLLGISGISNDMRDLLKERKRGNDRAKLAVEMFCYRVRKYIGAYLAAMGGAEAIIFTGGIGENAPEIRAEICGGLDALGIVIDEEKNQASAGTEGELSTSASKTKVWVVPTNEELLIARDTVRCILGLALDRGFAP